MLWLVTLVDMIILGLFFLYLWRFHKDFESSGIYGKVFLWVGTPCAFTLMIYGGIVILINFGSNDGSLTWMIAFISGPLFCLLGAISANFDVERSRRLKRMYGGGI